MKIGKVETKNNIFLGPMAGVTTKAFRTICLEEGAGLVYTEMVSDKGLIYHNQKTLEMITVSNEEHPLAMQLFGSSPETLKQACSIVLDNATPDIIDINMGCPVQKVVKSGSGSALLKDPKNIYDIVKTLKDNFDIPITAKIRLGWDHNSINVLEVAKALEKAGADAITVHARTRSDFYTGVALLDYIKQVKEMVSIPVIGNGDVKDIESANHMLQYTNCDGIMIARASLGNPWIFKQLSEYFQNNTIIEKPSKEEVLAMILNHAKRLEEKKGEHVAIVEMRTHAAWYLKQIPGTKSMRKAITSIQNYEELEQIVNAIKNNQFI